MTTPGHRRLHDLADATHYLESLINHERRADFTYTRLDLRPIQALLDRLDRPHDALSVIHVAGSKGKGSTCLFAEAILGRLGERVGTFTSPHLESWVERFRIAGEPVEAPRMVAAVERIRPLVEELRSGPPETVPSFFDATTAIAFLLFAEASVDRALIEVGLGGRLDSTNVVDPAVTCITSIELEHTDKLGRTEAAIAGEKAGILKSGRPAVLGRLGPEAADVIRARAQAIGAPILARDEAFEVELISSESGSIELNYREAGNDFEVRTPLRVPGAAALGNAGLAIACVRALGVHDDAAVARAAREGLSRCVLPARSEVLAGDAAVIVDAAHTAESARALASVLETLAPKGVDLLLSVSSDKNLDALLEALLPLTQRVVATCADRSRSLPADVLAKRILEAAPGLEVVVVDDPVEACRRARTELKPGATLCATGSIFLAGVARRVLGRASGAS